MTIGQYQILSKIDSPADLKKLNINELKQLSEEIREFLVDAISKTGGHLSASLGTVELTLALHYVFDTPTDKLVWDVGHQAYVHKIITGRRDVFHTLRQFGGISGFLKRDENEYDTFGAGHASTAISAALGMATARDLAKDKYRVAAIVGDGSMTGGMAFEAMNNTGLLKKNMIVILNDNAMSISPNVSAISNYFTQLIARPEYNRLKANVWDLTGKLDAFGDRLRKLAVRLEDGIKVIMTPGMLFEAFGFRYFGPLNGHNLPKLIKLMNEIKDLPGPILLHVVTQKGKGYKPAEDNSQKLHGVSPFDKVTGISPTKENILPTYTEVAGKTIVELAKANPKIVGITAAMPDGTGLDFLQKELPERFFDVGIAEQHAVTFGAGLATQGFIPFVAIYSTFLQRAFDQVIHDVALQNLHVIFAIDRGGIVGADGPTHHGIFDLAYLRIIPGLVVMVPKDEKELRDMFYTATKYTKGPIAIRYPRGTGLGVEMPEKMYEIPIGKAEILTTGKDVAILAVGSMVTHSLQAAEILSEQGIDCEIVNMRFVKPLDEQLLFNLFKRFNRIITVEEGCVKGGFGSSVLEFISQNNFNNLSVLNLGIDDSFVTQGSPQQLYELLKLDPKGIAESVLNFIKRRSE
ncbi:MAG: 1-deoxy-D-xylulose-5-phosphate synthase [Bacteroidetes bacterium]|nr:1-deoxy-D-xylulose-5-phosphate synthase [Bacteroidota bacterium]MBU1421582.1 1-deoxy-D-xylulose-5-phosphate synthase [Bacteroidota bacterium]MBU2471032.1 1-deoxy-D-xylulose-5-phosphate synthase [Bacteroidota bacterium]MBU2635584.1 1-deoxy-D-xylulose-5-phosphate synthase [Bacteroidota bacterium]